MIQVANPPRGRTCAHHVRRMAAEPHPLNENGGGVHTLQPVFMKELATREEFLSQTKEERFVLALATYFRLAQKKAGQS